MRLIGLKSLLVEHLKVLCACESTLAKRLPKLIDQVELQELRELLQGHLIETERHADVLASLANRVECSLADGRCRIVEILLDQAFELTEARGDERVMYVGIVAIIRQIEEYERTAYEAARSLAEAIDDRTIYEALDRNLLEESRFEQSMTVLFEDLIDSMFEGPESLERFRPGEAAAVR